MEYRHGIFSIFLIINLLSVTVLHGHRLPKSIKPEHYNLKVLTHLDDNSGFSYGGDVTITITALENTDQITLHAKDLNLDILNVCIQDVESSEDPYTVTNVAYDKLNDFVIMELSNELIKDHKYALHIPYNGTLIEGLIGYYRSSYFDKKLNDTAHLAVSNFEPTFARMALPCFDEPALKARFSVCLGHHKNYTSLSNMPLKTSVSLESYQADWVLDCFEESVPMSTYLLAFTVNNFKYKEVNSNGIDYKTWAREDVIHQADYSNYVGPIVLKYFEDYFDMKYPLPKVDMIAIPDFSAGAMENWGLITYREASLLYDVNSSTASAKAYVATVIAHELAHQWFGNLVTMQWWTDLWLNEGFATYVSSLGMRELYPERNFYNEEAVANVLDVYQFDALKASHPVSVPVQLTAQISEIFDHISYKKGGTIIRSMHLFLGEKAFRHGVSAYLKKYQYGNAQQDDLWNELTAKAHQYQVLPKHITVKKVMDTWTLQTGYPVVTVERDYKSNRALITQKRFLSANNQSRDDIDVCWWIPLTFTTVKNMNFNNTMPTNWLECDSSGKSVPLIIENMPADNDWILFNINLSGLYKVQYDKRNWQMITETLNSPAFKRIGEMNRAHIIADSLQLAWSGENEYGVAFKLLDYLAHESDYIPWNAAMMCFEDINRMLRRSAKLGNFHQYLRGLIGPLFKKHGGLIAAKTNEKDDVAKLKLLISNWACKLDIKECTDKAQNLFKEWSKTPAKNPIPSDLRATVYCNAIRRGDERDWNFLYARYLECETAAERTVMLMALGCSRQAVVLTRLLDWSITEEYGIRKQDSYTVFVNVAKSEVGFSVAMTFFEDKIDEIHEYLKSDSAPLKKYIDSLAKEITLAKDANRLSAVLNSKADIFKSYEKAVQSSLETVSNNMQWYTKNYATIDVQLQKMN